MPILFAMVFTPALLAASAWIAERQDVFMMLWHKAWLENRLRSLAGAGVPCALSRSSITTVLARRRRRRF